MSTLEIILVVGLVCIDVSYEDVSRSGRFRFTSSPGRDCVRRVLNIIANTRRFIRRW